MDAAIEPILNAGIGRSHGSKPWTQQHSGCIEVGDRELIAVNVRLVCKPAPQKLQRSVQSGCVNACFGPIGGVMGAFKHPEAAKGPRLFRPVQCEQCNTQEQMKSASKHTGWDGSR